MIKPYLNFLKRSLHSHPHDMVRPYHKVADLGFKIGSLVLAIIGCVYLVATPACYLATMEGERSTTCIFIIENYVQNITEPLSGMPTVEFFVAYWLTGLGYMVIAIFVSQVLLVRLLNETLPDHIYLRCFATLEEKKKRLNIKD